jgi:hypothetical protein
MAKYVYSQKVKKKLFLQLKRNKYAYPISKFNAANELYLRNLKLKSFNSMKLYLFLQIEKFKAKLEAQNKEIADIMFSDKQHQLKIRIFSAWAKYASKKGRKKQRKYRILAKEFFYKWKLFAKIEAQ